MRNKPIEMGIIIKYFGLGADGGAGLAGEKKNKAGRRKK